MPVWKIAAVQMDVRLAEKAVNLDLMRRRLREAASQGARLIVFPECALTGYSFASKEQARPHAEPLPGPATERLAADCRELSVWTAFGLLERDDERLFNACALLGPHGFVAGYRKVHLPYLGVDRFATPGDRPFAVHDLNGLRVGMNICYDGSFPEAARVLTLLGADLIVLPTNWTTEARAACFLPEARALENHVYYLAVNRVGEERGFRFVGRSRLLDYRGQALAVGGDAEETIYGEIEPEQARVKRVIVIPGQHEVDRVGDRRPKMYGPLVQPLAASEESAGRRRPSGS
jgi:predicted amidohydrolase